MTILTKVRDSLIFYFIYTEAWFPFKIKLLFLDDFTLNQIFLQLIFEYFDIFIQKANRNHHCSQKIVWKRLFLSFESNT